MSLAAAQCQVAGALKELNDLPESIKQMLLQALPNAFGPNVHPFQKEAGMMVRKALEQGRTLAETRQADAAQQVKEARTVLEALQADAESSVATEDAARIVLAEKVATLQTAEANVKNEQILLDNVDAERKTVEAEQEKLEACKAEVESIQNGSFRTLVDGGWEDEEVRDLCIDGVCGYLNAQGADAVLMAALPKALGLRPENCGAFDKASIEAANAFILDKVASCSANVARGDEKLSDIKSEYLGAWAILDLAREEVAAAAQVRDTAESELQKATVDKKLAHSKVTEQDAALSDLLAEATLADAKVQQLEQALNATVQLETGEPEKDDAMEVDAENTAVVEKQKAMMVGNDEAMATDHVQSIAGA